MNAQGVIGGDPPALLASSEGATECPAAWTSAAARALLARGVWAGPSEGRFIFAVPVGHVGALDRPATMAVLVLEIAARVQMDLALTRERLVALSALCEAITQAAAGSLAVGAASAAAAAEALLRAPDRRSGFAEAARVLARSAAGIERLALVRLARGRVADIAVADEPTLDRAADLPQRLVGLVEEAFDGEDLVVATQDGPGTPAQEAYFARFGRHPLFARLSPGRRLGIAAALYDDRSPTDAALALAPALSLLERVLDPRPPLLAPRRRNAWLWRTAGAGAAIGLLAVLPRVDAVEAPATFQPEWQQVISAPFDGVVERSTVQPGDRVEAGTTVLARLETREIELEIAAANARAANELRDATVARAAGQPARSSSRSSRRSAPTPSSRFCGIGLRQQSSARRFRASSSRAICAEASGSRSCADRPCSRSRRTRRRALISGCSTRSLPRRARTGGSHPARRRARSAEERYRRARAPDRGVVQSRNSFLVVALLDPDDEPLRPGSEGIAHIETGRTTWLASLLRQPVRYVRQLLWIDGRASLASFGVKGCRSRRRGRAGA